MNDSTPTPERRDVESETRSRRPLFSPAPPIHSVLLLYGAVFIAGTLVLAAAAHVAKALREPPTKDPTEQPADEVDAPPPTRTPWYTLGLMDAADFFDPRTRAMIAVWAPWTIALGALSLAAGCVAALAARRKPDRGAPLKWQNYLFAILLFAVWWAIPVLMASLGTLR